MPSIQNTPQSKNSYFLPLKNAGQLCLSCIFYLPLYLMKPSELAVGGQAVLEGVMMRGQKGYSIAVRRPNGKIASKDEHKIPWTKQYKLLGIPVLRGVVTLVEAMIIGFKALEYSANVSLEEKDDENESGANAPAMSKTTIFFTFIVSMALAMGLFVVLPNVITQFMRINEATSPFLFHVVAGIIRMFLFLAYIIGISQMKDIRRVFEYHGAEHKTIRTYEADEDLQVINAKKHSRFHPRCGTSFILMVMVISIFIFAFVTGFIVQYWAGFTEYAVWLQKLILIPAHIIAMLPVAGLSYEVNRKCSRCIDSPLSKLIVSPGLWFQRLTTREPDETQLEVAIHALNRTLEMGDV